MTHFKTNTHQAKIYTVNGGVEAGKSQPDWLGSTITRAHRERAKRKKKKIVQTGTEGKSLIQDFDFPEASNKIKSTLDGKFLIATGTYKPRMKVYELDELALKFDRVTDTENVDFCILSTDWTKTLHLQADRTLDLHTQTASHYKVRIPRHGRALAYHFPSCDAICGGAGSELWRLNLQQGRFLSPFQLSNDVLGVNSIDINPAHGLIALGTETEIGQGTVEFWDHRAQSRVGLLRLPHNKLLGLTHSNLAHDYSTPVSVTALASRLDGLTIAVGSSTGHTLLYDLRASSPHTTKDQGYGLPIKKIEWPTSVSASGFGQTDGLVATTDSKVFKIWSRHTTENLISVNPLASVNDMHIYPDSGLVLLANEASPMTGYFIPSLGPAPRWCRFLENMTEEMEESNEVTLYDDYKFVSEVELKALSLDHLVGTPALRPYMHGYFIDLRLYAKAKAIANPFAYVEHRDKLVKERLQKEQESRIRTSKMKAKSNHTESVLQNVKINKELAQRIIQENPNPNDKVDRSSEKAPLKKKGKNKASAGQSLLNDQRFADLFTNEEFEIDEFSQEFAALNPSSAAAARNKAHQSVNLNSDDSDEEVEEGDGISSDSENSSSEDSSEDDDIWKKKESNKKLDKLRSLQKPKKSLPEAELYSIDLPPQNKPKMIINDTDEHLRTTTTDQRTKTFGEQLAGGSQNSLKSKAGLKAQNGSTENEMVRELGGGAMEISFTAENLENTKSDEIKKNKKKGSRLTETFGIGLSKGSVPIENEIKLDEEHQSGRKQKRRIERSASRKKIKTL
ncbi:hypothetical protein O181_044124 [Austropuccinia psidii MF-1]|uniref:NUC153 domain-containing protein n=1 Tax=Austropuccinia psidii MF-1 TaxID=1389203 RepID=A0A9Q3DJE9_9BASI|nr:hypothetical protein [Austropuccinia psidii MF-1]